jgi:hypothetical protein
LPPLDAPLLLVPDPLLPEPPAPDPLPELLAPEPLPGPPSSPLPNPGGVVLDPHAITAVSPTAANAVCILARRLMDPSVALFTSAQDVFFRPQSNDRGRSAPSRSKAGTFFCFQWRSNLLKVARPSGQYTWGNLSRKEIDKVRRVGAVAEHPARKAAVGSHLFFATFTRVRPPTSSSPTFTCPMRRTSNRIDT